MARITRIKSKKERDHEKSRKPFRDADRLIEKASREELTQALYLLADVQADLHFKETGLDRGCGLTEGNLDRERQRFKAASVASALNSIAMNPGPSYQPLLTE
ncbi:hypothetical protein [Desulfopila sp. IMCC35008]|uniref:hypothetical protein n=1 Tax=Desulfopila sp. IMCC35008 TaxID=2653858 RepID=UPI0013D7AB76|nr:hypothetical protein [Desulfopila sp. IMCC35008]